MFIIPAVTECPYCGDDSDVRMERIGVTSSSVPSVTMVGVKCSCGRAQSIMFSMSGALALYDLKRQIKNAKARLRRTQKVAS